MEASVKYTVLFRNDARSPIHIYWIDYRGVPQLRGALLAGGVFSQQTYYTHPWTFQTATDGKELNASANGVSSLVFEGKEFKASPDSTILVAIVDQGIIS